VKEVTEVSLKFNFDQLSGDTFTELNLVPKPGTAFAKDVAAQQATSNRFGKLVPKDAAVGVVVKAPLFAKELREIATALVEAGRDELNEGNLPEKLKPVVEEAAKGLIKSVEAGNLDAGLALVGPNQAGTFTLIAGISLDNSAAVEKALREGAKASEFAKEFEFDAAKVGEVSIHKVPLLRVFPEEALGELAKGFGDKPPAYVAFAKDAVFIGFGADALSVVKTALATKPEPAPWIELTGNMARLQKFVTTIDERAGAMFAKHLGTDDKAVSMFRLTVDGGQSLKVKITVNVRYLPKAFLIDEMGGAKP
jgi:hypothetical protein